MNLSLLENGTPTTKPWCNLVTNDIDTNTLEVKGVPVTPPYAPVPVTGQYNANIVLTNASNLSQPSGGTLFYQVGNMWTIFGEFKCDLAATNNFNFAIDLVAGTTNTVAKRSIQCSSHRNGGQPFLMDFDGNASPSRLTITMRSVAPATVVGQIFPYTITYQNF